MKKTSFNATIFILLALCLMLPKIASSTPDTDTRFNFFGETPPATYGDWVYVFQQYEWLGTYKTSSSPTGTGVGSDDGISFGSLAGGSTGTLTYTIKTGPYSGLEYFYVWADWNNNGNWLDPGELIADLDLTVSANSTVQNPVSFSVPAYYDGNLVGGDLWFNAVVSHSNSTAGISGSWLSGEQEAFKVPVQPIPEPTTILLLSVGLVGLLGIGIRRKRRKQS